MSQAKTLSEQEIKQVLDYVSTKKYGVRDRALVITSHLSGMRVGEIASLTVGHVLDASGSIKGEIRLTAEQTGVVLFLLPKVTVGKLALT